MSRKAHRKSTSDEVLEIASQHAFPIPSLSSEDCESAYDRLNAEYAAVLKREQEANETIQRLLTANALLEARCQQMEAINSQLEQRATRDGMTGLANHRAFQEELARQLARADRSRTFCSLLLLDVDHFKKYNDAFGHPAGDDVLKIVAQVLRESVREGDFPARYGGEEFAVILPETDAATAVQVAERVRIAIASRSFPHREITVSIGVSQRNAEEPASTVIERADVALYEAKAGGRNRVVNLEPTPEMDSLPVPCLKPEEMEDTVVTLPENLDVEEIGASLLCLSEEEEYSEFMDEAIPSNMAAGLEYGGLEGLLQEPVHAILEALLSAMDMRSAEPNGHSQRVTRFTMRLSRELASWYDSQRETRPMLPRLTQSDITAFALGGLLHDIGKIGIPDEILHKSGELTSEEWRRIRRHPLAGVELLSHSPLLARALPIVRYHHERWDGHGYPHGLAGEAIPLGARIFLVCDTLESLLNDKPYRPRMLFEQAAQEIVAGAGTQFDPDVVKAFLRVPREEWEALTQNMPDTQADSNSLRYAA